MCSLRFQASTIPLLACPAHKLCVVVRNRACDILPSSSHVHLDCKPTCNKTNCDVSTCDAICADGQFVAPAQRTYGTLSWFCRISISGSVSVSYSAATKRCITVFVCAFDRPNGNRDRASEWRIGASNATADWSAVSGQQQRRPSERRLAPARRRAADQRQMSAFAFRFAACVSRDSVASPLFPPCVCVRCFVRLMRITATSTARPEHAISRVDIIESSMVTPDAPFLRVAADRAAAAAGLAAAGQQRGVVRGDRREQRRHGVLAAR